jgi:hypothetical protein
MTSKYNIDLTGKRFGKLIVIKGLDDYTVNNGCKGYRKWQCLCACGKITVSSSFNLLRNIAKSCGIKGCGGGNYKIPDIVGEKYGKLTVIELLDELRNGGRVWLCKCECGKYKKLKTTMLVRNIITSCGCSNIIYKDRTIPAAKEIYNNYKKRAKVKKIEFNMTLDEFINLAKSDCFYCGSKPKNCRTTNKRYKNISEFIYNGLDRVDNYKGYTIINCVPCCFMCNNSKGTNTVEEFINKILNISSHLKNVIKNKNESQV